MKISGRGKAIYVTGCDSGFGFQLCKRLVSEGSLVFANCLSEEGAKRLKEELFHSNRLVTLVHDIRDEKSVEMAARVINQELETRRFHGLYALVNNAGIVDDQVIEGNDMKSYRKVMDVNFFGAVQTTKSVLKLLRKAGLRGMKPRVVNIASAAGKISSQFMSAYASSKFALEAFNDSLRREMQYFGISVVIIEPGLFKTNIVTGNPTLLDRKIQNMDPEIICIYGDKYLRSVNEVSVSLAADPIFVVDEMMFALTARWPAIRVTVGTDCILGFAPLSWIPACVSDFLLHVWLPKPAPTC